MGKIKILEVGSREFYNGYFKWIEMLRESKVDKIIVTKRGIPVFEVTRMKIEGV